MIFTICPNYWQRNFYCDKCGAMNKSGPRWHCQLHRKDICTKCEPGRDVSKVKRGVRCPKGEHWMCWSKNMNPRRKTYMCLDCSRCYINSALRWHCKEHDVDLCPECEPGMAQRLQPGHRVKWMGSSDRAKILMENVGNGDTNLGKLSNDSIGKVKHMVDDEWVAVKFPEGTWDIKRIELLIVDGRGAVEGLCCQCGALGIPGWRDPDIDDFFCEVCWAAFLAEPGESVPAVPASGELPWDQQQSKAGQDGQGQRQASGEPKLQVCWDRDVGVRFVPAAAAPEDAAELQGEAAAFELGEQVLVVGLQERPEHNGRRGQVIRFDAQAGKYVIRPEGGAKLAKLKPENLRALPGGPCSPPSQAAAPSGTPAAEGELPPGWRSARDRGTGREYYWPAHDRQAVTWVRPLAPAAAAAQA